MSITEINEIISNAIEGLESLSHIDVQNTDAVRDLLEEAQEKLDELSETYGDDPDDVGDEEDDGV